MNVFVLDVDPRRAARDQCDKHVVKMVLESAQLLSTMARVLHPELDVVLGPRSGLLYRKTHVNHTVARWLRSSTGNVDWLHEHARAQLAQYSKRYGRIHKVEREGILSRAYFYARSGAPQGERTPFVFCGPEPYMAAAMQLGETGDTAVVTAYRLFYMGDKRRFARWRFPCSPPPAWWV